jgi:hypothetical protein
MPRIFSRGSRQARLQEGVQEARGALFFLMLSTGGGGNETMAVVTSTTMAASTEGKDNNQLKAAV